MWFILPLPPGINKTYKKGRGKYGIVDNFYKTKEAKEWEEIAGWEIKKVWKNKKPIKGNCCVFINLYLERNRDLDSCTKIVFDLLQRQHVITNDSLIISSRQEKYKIIPDEIATNPHLEVMIEEV